MRFVLGAFSACLLVGCGAAVSDAAAATMPLAPLPKAPAAAVSQAEYYCSPGYEPGRRGVCRAVSSTSEVDLYIDQPIAEYGYRYIRHRRHVRRGMRERF